MASVDLPSRWCSQARPSLWSLGEAIYWLVPMTLVAALYAPTAGELWRAWDVDPNYSHGPIVVVFSILLAAHLSRRRGEARSTFPVSDAAATVSRSDVLRGYARFALGFALHTVAIFVGSLLLDVVGLVFLLLGMLVVLGGADIRRAYGFPVLFLLFAAPLPVGWYQPGAIALQQVVSATSGHLLNMAGIATYREGYFLHLSEMSLEVGEACSGIRQLTAVVALAAAMGFLSGRGRWFRILLILSAIPIAVASNCLRVMITGILSHAFGRSWAEGFFHEAEGMVLVLFSALLMYALATLAGGRATPPEGAPS
jgi:exosortase